MTAVSPKPDNAQPQKTGPRPPLRGGPMRAPKLNMHSFRAKFILVVGAAVLFDLLLASSIAIYNVRRLSEDATAQVGQGLTAANEEYLQTYISATALRADLLLDRVHSDVSALAGAIQQNIDNPELQEKVGSAVRETPALSTPLQYHPQGNWTQNEPGGASVVSVWGYLLGADRQPLPAAAAQIRDSAIIELFAPALMKTGAPKLQLYYVGPKAAPIMRTVPYTEQAQTFDRLYEGHNEHPFWEFFFPGAYESWQGWLRDPGSQPVQGDPITITAPYVDAITGKLIVSFFHPLFDRTRSDVAGMVAADVTLEQLATVVESVKVADTGFGFLAMSNGNIIAVNPAGEKTLGLTASEGGGSGVTGVDRSLKGSAQAAISGLVLPSGDRPVMNRIVLQQDGKDVPYTIVLKRLAPTNLWVGEDGIQRETMSLGVLVPDAEIYGSLNAAKDAIGEATNRIVNFQLAAVVFCLGLVAALVLALSRRITAGLSMLADAARRLQAKDYSVRVDIPAQDEIGELGSAFNAMAEEISFHTENLESLVEERTRDLEGANREINALNARLRTENLRMGAELDVARQIQNMVLPKLGELEAIPPIEIAGFMQPADEVGGDYYDVLQDGNRVKVGIGDVTGHGLESGVLMLMVQSVARALQEKGEGDPKAFLSVLNRAIYKNIERTASDKHMTLAFLDYEDGRITMSGQHEEVLLLRQGGALERIDTVDLGFPIGLESDIAPFVDTRTVPFASGDIIVLHTDGVTEAENPAGELFGLDRLCASVQKHRAGSAEEIRAAVVADLMAHIDTQKIHDDITLVVMRHR